MPTVGSLPSRSDGGSEVMRSLSHDLTARMIPANGRSPTYALGDASGRMWWWWTVSAVPSSSHLTRV